MFLSRRLGPHHYCEDMLTQALHRLGIAVMRSPDPHAEFETGEMKLMARSSAELDMAVGSAVLILVGFVLIWALGLPAEWIWKSKAGAGAGGLVCAVGLTGYLLHYARSRVLDSRTRRTQRERESLKETFWTSSSDVDLIFQLAIGIVVFVLTYVS